jgi:hypothetical protein
MSNAEKNFFGICYLLHGTCICGAAGIGVKWMVEVGLGYRFGVIAGITALMLVRAAQLYRRGLCPLDGYKKETTDD